MLPKIKKKLKSFILEEEGRISKQSVLKIGSVLAMSLLASSHDVLGGCGCGGGSCGGGSSGGSVDPCGGGGGGSCGGCGCGGCGCETSGTGGAYCLLNNSLVAIDQTRTKRIQDLEVSENVISFDHIRNKVIKTKITKIIRNHIRDYFYIINNGIFITNDHPMLVMRNNSYMWVKVEDMIVGDKVKSLEGFTNIISIVKIMRSENTVYLETESGNFIVKDLDNYYVVKGNYIENELLEENVLLS